MRVGIDIGGTKYNVGIFDSDLNLVCSVKKSVLEVKSFPSELKDVICDLCEKNGIDYFSIDSLGVGIPGTVSASGREILKAPNISVLEDNFADKLECALNIPVRLVQDSRAAAYGEYVCGAGKGKKNVVCVTLGTGIGTGIVVDGKIFDGALGSAGELGHLPVRGGSRPCGCGKIGCLEKYAAGRGLDISAAELLGEGASAKDLFCEMDKGNERAKEIIDNAIEELGIALVSIVNLLSPDCLLFSGGLSEQDYYLNSLISYVSEHCYSSGSMPEIKKSALGELSPLYGAAAVGCEKRRSNKMLSASIMCADVLNMQSSLDQIKSAGIEYLHCDIMDNHFVPNLMLSTEYLNKLKEATDLPFDYHIMAYNPDSVIERLNISAGDFVSVHYESTHHLQRAISLVKTKGGRPAVAINPATPISVLEEILPEIDMVLIMSVNPGFAGQKIVPTSFDKIRKTRKYLDDLGYNDILIEVDGNVSFENIPKMKDAGTDIYVVGTSSVFKKGQSIADGVRAVRKLLD